MRLRSLDSLRGVAAFVVVLHHAMLATGMDEDRQALLARGFAVKSAWIYLTPLRIFVAGPAMVLLFFVLSGLVLAIAFVDRDGDAYLPFVIKRIARIWLPFAAAICLSALLAALLGNAPLEAGNGWFNSVWKIGPSLSNIVAHLLMTGTSIDLDNPMWSLIHELRISLIFPFLVYAMKKNWIATLGLSVLLAPVAYEIGAGVFPHGVAHSLSSTAMYVWLFAAGAGLAINFRALRNQIERAPSAVHAALWCLALLLLCAAPVRTDAASRLLDVAQLYLAGFGAFLVIFLSAVEGRAFAVLLGRIPSYLGRISYSLYLTHVIVMVGTVRLLQGFVPYGWSILISLPLALLVAEISQRLIEVPSTYLGRRLAMRVAAMGHPAPEIVRREAVGK